MPSFVPEQLYSGSWMGKKKIDQNDKLYESRKEKRENKDKKWKNLYKNNSYYSSLEEFGSKLSSSSLNKTGLVT